MHTGHILMEFMAWQEHRQQVESVLEVEVRQCAYAHKGEPLSQVHCLDGLSYAAVRNNITYQWPK